MGDDGLGRDVVSLEAHAAQLRAEALDFLYEQGEEYLDFVNAAIDLMQAPKNPHRRIFGVLAEVGLLATMLGHASTIESGQ